MLPRDSDKAFVLTCPWFWGRKRLPAIPQTGKGPVIRALPLLAILAFEIFLGLIFPLRLRKATTQNEALSSAHAATVQHQAFGRSRKASLGEACLCNFEPHGVAAC